MFDITRVSPTELPLSTRWEDIMAGGPDAYAEIHFAEQEEGDLVDLVGGWELPGYDRLDVIGVPVDNAGDQSGPETRFILFADHGHSEQVFEHITGERDEKVWLYRVIRVGDGRVTFERGFGWPGWPECGSSDVGLLVQLIDHAALRVVDWRIATGGGGYPWQEQMRGSGERSLLRMLTGQVSLA